MSPGTPFAALAALLISGALGPAQAGEIESRNCVGQGGALSCGTTWGRADDSHIRTVPGPSSDQEAAELAERDRRWVARCRPVTKQDRYGVSRYYYAAAGCEFGVIGVNLIKY
jgi:hypothetical protein